MKPELKILRRTCANGLRVVLVQKPDYQKSMFMMGINCWGPPPPVRSTRSSTPIMSCWSPR